VSFYNDLEDQFKLKCDKCPDNCKACNSKAVCSVCFFTYSLRENGKKCEKDFLVLVLVVVFTFGMIVALVVCFKRVVSMWKEADLEVSERGTRFREFQRKKRKTAKKGAKQKTKKSSEKKKVVIPSIKLHSIFSSSEHQEEQKSSQKSSTSRNGKFFEITKENKIKEELPCFFIEKGENLVSTNKNINELGRTYETQMTSGIKSGIHKSPTFGK
jgi:hypothetical protein